MREGDVAYIAGRPVKVVMRFREFARIAWIDGLANIRHRWVRHAHLVSLDLAYGPRAVWPEGGSLEKRYLEEEERRVEIERIAERARARRARRKGLKHAA